MSIWENVYYHAKEELDALQVRKRSSPQSKSLDLQLQVVRQKLSEAKIHLKQD